MSQLGDIVELSESAEQRAAEVARRRKLERKDWLAHRDEKEMRGNLLAALASVQLHQNLVRDFCSQIEGEVESHGHLPAEAYWALKAVLLDRLNICDGVAVMALEDKFAGLVQP